MTGLATSTFVTTFGSDLDDVVRAFHVRIVDVFVAGLAGFGTDESGFVGFGRGCRGRGFGGFVFVSGCGGAG